MATRKDPLGIDAATGTPNEQIQNREEKPRRRSSLFFGAGTAAPPPPAQVHIPFRRKIKYPDDTKLMSLYNYAESLVEAGRVARVTSPPAETALNDWLAVNVLVYYNAANNFYGWLNNERCTCQKMTIGHKYEFLWADGKTIRNPINIPANDYVDYLMTWIEANLADTKLFPDYDGAKYSKTYMDTVKAIMRRLFRVFGHMQVDHAQDLQACGVLEKHERVFQCFVQLVREYKLMDKKQLKPIHKEMAQWKAEK